MSGVTGWLGAAFLVAGLLVITVSLYGIHRMPDVYTRVHSAGKAVVLGVAAVALGSIGTGQAQVIVRALLVAVVLLFTAPVSAHAIARAAYRAGEPMAPEDAVDESGRLRPRAGARGTATHGTS